MKKLAASNGCFLLQLVIEDVVREYKGAKRRLLVLGYNSTLTTAAVEPPRLAKNHYDQLKVVPPASDVTESIAVTES